MVKVALSRAALEKLGHDSIRSALSDSGHAVPRFLYHHRCYTTLKDGSVIEHGPGLILSFTEPAEIQAGDYVSIEAGRLTVFVAPPSVFSAQPCFIDWDGKDFVLTGDETSS